MRCVVRLYRTHSTIPVASASSTTPPPTAPTTIAISRWLSPPGGGGYTYLMLYLVQPVSASDMAIARLLASRRSRAPRPPLSRPGTTPLRCHDTLRAGFTSKTWPDAGMREIHGQTGSAEAGGMSRHRWGNVGGGGADQDARRHKVVDHLLDLVRVAVLEGRAARVRRLRVEGAATQLHRVVVARRRVVPARPPTDVRHTPRHESHTAPWRASQTHSAVS
eukprot:3898095-Rhodomonas_salina.1